jgi:hypothetical protein
MTDGHTHENSFWFHPVTSDTHICVPQKAVRGYTNRCL